MNIILSTRNPSKAEQIKGVFSDFPANILTLDEADIVGEAVEDGETLKENALKKAIYAFARLREKTWVMADDTGFYITALRGAPGIHAARWAGDVPTEEITKHTLKQLEGKSDRSASFVTVVALIAPNSYQYYFEGRVDGTILEAPRTKPQPKMPYSPIFVPDGHDQVWAEMTVEQENAISHRGKAFRKTKEYILRLSS